MSAPSFNSFPKSFSSFPDFEEGSSSLPSSHKDRNSDSRKHREHDQEDDLSKKTQRSRSRERGDGKKEKRKHDRHEKDEERRHKHRDRKPKDRSEERHASHTKQTRVDSTDLMYREDGSVLFIYDRKGDPLNITYGGLHSGDIPRYRYFAGGRKVLGLDSHKAVIYRGSRGIEIGEQGIGRRKIPQLTSSGTRAMLENGRTRRLVISANSASKYEEEDGIIKLPSRKGKAPEQSYRSITKDEKADSSSEASESVQEESDEESDTIEFSAREEELRKREQIIKQDPSSEKAWLSLIEHTISSIPSSTKNAEKARSEITMSILSRAFNSHSNNARLPSLRLKYLKSGESVWNEQKLKNEWETALGVCPSADLWVEWVDWRLRRGTNGLEDTLQGAERAIHKVDQSLTGTNSDKLKLRIFWRVAIFFKQAGFTERATALFQAEAELLFNMPANLKPKNFEEQLDALEEFWDSEIPRIGEHSAIGWSNWVSSGQQESEDSRPSRSGIFKISSGKGDPYRSWAEDELRADASLSLPQRASDGDGSDPFASILFSDIRPFLFLTQTNAGKDLFCEIWLSFLGLHIPGLVGSLSSDKSDERWAETAYVSRGFMSSLFPREESRHLINMDSYSGTIVGRERTYRDSFGVVKDWSHGLFEPLEGVFVNGKGRMWESFDGDVDFVRNIFRLINSQSSAMSILSVAFEAVFDIKSATKAYRSLPRFEVMEFVYVRAQLERLRKDPDRARKCYEEILSHSSQMGDSAVYYWWSYAEFEWLLSREQQALHIVLRAAGKGGPVDRVLLLRSKRSSEERSRASLDWKLRLRWNKLRLLLELLSGEFEDAISLAKRLQSEEIEGTVEHEAVTIGFLIIFYHHTMTLKNPAPPSLLRELAQFALEKYPNNSIALGVFLECEKGEGIWGRVRSLLGDNVIDKPEKSLSRKISDIYIASWEKSRWEGELERTRAGLESALVHDRTRGSSLLWRIYVEFEIFNERLKQAKTVLLRALGECPLIKEFYLLAFGPLRTVFSDRELRTLADTMAERGLRLRRTLDEALENVSIAEEDDRGSESADEDEIEYNSRELRRLMPY